MAPLRNLEGPFRYTKPACSFTMARGISRKFLDIPTIPGEFLRIVRTCKRGKGLAVAFHTKLRMAAAALGCSSRKEFCARFRNVNKTTQCDLDRLSKWMQGRS